MISLDSFLTRLLPQVPACPEPTALQALLDASIDFCEETQVVRYVTAPVALVAGTGTYALTVPSDTRVSRIIRAWCGSRRLVMVPAAEIDSPLAYVTNTGDATASQGAPTLAYTKTAGSVSVYPLPDTASASTYLLSALVALSPTRAATTVDDSLFNEWVEYIVAGALYRLALTPGTPYSDAAVATAAVAVYRLGVNRARVEANRNRTGGDVVVAMHPFA